MRARRPLWRCPKCGHRFVTKNLWHSCGRYDLKHHFAGKEPIVRKLYDRLVAIVKTCGPVTIYPQKTRLVAMVEVRFINVSTAKRSLRVGVWLKRAATHPAIDRHEDYGKLGFGNIFKFESVGEMDADFRKIVREAYRIGCRA